MQRVSLGVGGGQRSRRSPPASSRQDGVVYLLVGVWRAGDLLERAAVALGQKVVAGRVQDGADAL